jgi:hypothetical protein
MLLAGCSTNPRKSAQYKALNRSRSEVIAAAREIRNESKSGSQPSENFSGNYSPCPGKGSVHYVLETDWITPRGDADDLQKFDYVVKTLLNGGWKDAATPSRRERIMRHGKLAIGIVIRPGADWIEGDLGGPCYKVGDVAEDFFEKGMDHLT